MPSGSRNASPGLGPDPNPKARQGARPQRTPSKHTHAQGPWTARLRFSPAPGHWVAFRTRCGTFPFPLRASKFLVVPEALEHTSSWPAHLGRGTRNWTSRRCRAGGAHLSVGPAFLWGQHAPAGVGGGGVTTGHSRRVWTGNVGAETPLLILPVSSQPIPRLRHDQELSPCLVLSTPEHRSHSEHVCT